MGENSAGTRPSVVDDMLRLHIDHGVDAFYTIDDVFSLDRERVVDICHGLIKHNHRIHWTIQTRGDLIDLDLLKLMKRAGCVGVKMGIESGVDRILKIIRKNSTRQLLDAARACQEAGLILTTYYMVGHPSETRDEMEETFRFAKEVGSDMVQMAFHTPYPGSQSYEMVRDKVADLSELNHYETQHVNLSEVDSETMEKLQRQFYLEYYFHPKQLLKYLRRRALYRLSDPTEWQLAAMSLRYLLGNRGRVGKSAVDPRPIQRPSAASEKALAAVPRHNVNLTGTELRWVVRGALGAPEADGGRADFEADCRRYFGAAHVIAVESGRTALYLALHGLGIQAGDTVVLPRYCFYSLVNVVEGMGCTARFAPSIPIPSRSIRGSCPSTWTARVPSS